jgi:hypothetical protein
MMVGVFAFSGTMAALAGVLVSYSLASASPAGLSDVIVPAATAAILGGVSLSGGTRAGRSASPSQCSFLARFTPGSMPWARRPTRSKSPWAPCSSWLPSPMDRSCCGG